MKQIVKYYEIGFDGDTITNARQTLKQIQSIEKYKLDIYDKYGRKLDWDDIYDKTDSYKLCSVIYYDRKMRAKVPMADRPPFLRFTTIESKIIRMEFYFGHDKLEKLYDFGNDTYAYLFNECNENVDMCNVNSEQPFLNTKLQQLHDTLIKPEIAYLRVRNTLSLHEHTNSLIDEETIKMFTDILFDVFRDFDWS